MTDTMEEFINALTSAPVLASVFLTFAIQFFFKRIPIYFKKFLRGVRFRQLKKIRTLRHNQDAVTYESIKANTYFLLFCGSAALFLILVTIGPLSAIITMPLWGIFIFASPVLFIEMMWLSQNDFAKSLINYRAKLRVTSGSKRRINGSLN